VIELYWLITYQMKMRHVQASAYMATMVFLFFLTPYSGRLLCQEPVSAGRYGPYISMNDSSERPEAAAYELQQLRKRSIADIILFICCILAQTTISINLFISFRIAGSVVLFKLSRNEYR